MHVVVSIPTYNTPLGLLQRSVKSVLQQTHSELTVIVLWDGGTRESLGIRDDRLVEFGWLENRGRFFADAVVLQALDGHPDVYWKPHDSDDWSEPDGIEVLKDSMIDGVAFSPHYLHEEGRNIRISPLDTRRLTNPPRPLPLGPLRRSARRLKSLGLRVPASITNPVRGGASWCAGLYSVHRVHLAGGVHPDFRTSYDSLFVRLVARTGRVGLAEVPTYHYDRRNRSSLTRSTSTRTGSLERESSLTALGDLDQRAWMAACPAEIVRGSISPSRALDVKEHAAQLTAILERRSDL